LPGSCGQSRCVQDFLNWPVRVVLEKVYETTSCRPFACQGWSYESLSVYGIFHNWCAVQLTRFRARVLNIVPCPPAAHTAVPKRHSPRWSTVYRWKLPTWVSDVFASKSGHFRTPVLNSAVGNVKATSTSKFEDYGGSGPGDTSKLGRQPARRPEKGGRAHD
jgi:hypothetical protein